MIESTRNGRVADTGTTAVAHPLPACRLVRLIGKAPEDWTVDDLVGVVGKLGVRLVSLMHVGGDGWLKTLDFVPRDFAAPARSPVFWGACGRVQSLRRLWHLGHRLGRRPSPAAVHGVHRPVRVLPDACRLLRPLRPRRRAAARIARHNRPQGLGAPAVVDGHRVAGARRGGVLPRAAGRRTPTSTAPRSGDTAPARRSSSASRCGGARW